MPTPGCWRMCKLIFQLQRVLVFFLFFSMFISLDPSAVLVSTKSLGLSHDVASFRRLQQFPAALNALLRKSGYYALSNLVEVARSKSQNSRSSARQTNTKQARLRAWGHRLNNLSQARDERLPVRLVQLVLHGEIDQIGVGWRLAQCYWEQCYTLEVECLSSTMG